jgi:hypothetical protein
LATDAGKRIDRSNGRSVGKKEVDITAIRLKRDVAVKPERFVNVRIAGARGAIRRIKQIDANRQGAIDH